MALGEILRNAREQKGLSPSVVAESTHMKVQVVEDLEHEDFRRIAAPIYGRGFVKLYAEFLQLDPEPLIRDFMELYAGARAPAVRMKRVDAPAEQPQECVPITRTVTGAGSAVPPQKQPVQPKPAVRPLSVPVAIAKEEEKPIVAEEPEPKLPEVREEEKPALGEPLPAAAVDTAFAAPVFDSEEGFEESDEPDLFRPQTLRRRPSEPVDEPEDDRKPVGATRSETKPKLPIFKIGGRLEEKTEPALQDDAAHARRRARIESFISGFKNLRDGVERNLPSNLPRKQLLVLGGAAAAVVVLMAAGIGVLFKMTGSNVKEKPGTVVGLVAPLPDLYVD